MTTKVIAIPEFDKRLKALKKKYPNIRKDIETLLAQLADGETPGDQLQEMAHIVYKVRLPNRDAQRGKSGGYRLIYYVRKADTVYLITIYSKSEFDSVPDAQVVRAIESLQDEPESPNSASDDQG
jgi:mRNA-degrading endonuclease RelE of RelBE toxin-antitoxin system